MSQEGIRLMLDPVAGVKREAYEQGKREAARQIIREFHDYALHYPNDDTAVRQLVVDELWNFYIRLSNQYPQATT